VANMEHCLGTLPDTIEVLHCTNHSHELGVLPTSLTWLKIEGSKFNHSLGLLPNGLVELDLSTAVDFQQPLGILPQSLQTVKLHSNYAYVHDLPQHILAVAAPAVAAAAFQHAIAAAVAAPQLAVEVLAAAPQHAIAAEVPALVAAAATAVAAAEPVAAAATAVAATIAEPTEVVAAPMAAAVLLAVIDNEPVQTNSTKWFKRAAVAATAAAVTTAMLYGAKLVVIWYLLRSI
jgi:hypothetical protein